ncbi:MAG TPA: hypothetical protein VNX21_03710 [Candidatus Thermoplasmatota archaeon]|nr:hypothetical protein [Candidatus Thermoplasmatota archaeon]
MPTYIHNTASIAAAATDENVVKDRRYRQSQRPRVLKAIAAQTLDNTPAEDDLQVTLMIGEREVAVFAAGLARTTGAPMQAEDWIPVNERVEQGEPVTVKIQNLDAAAAHRARVALSFDGY